MRAAKPWVPHIPRSLRGVPGCPRAKEGAARSVNFGTACQNCPTELMHILQPLRFCKDKQIFQICKMCMARPAGPCRSSPEATRWKLPSVPCGDSSLTTRTRSEHRLREHGPAGRERRKRMPGVSGGDSSFSWTVPSILGVRVGGKSRYTPLPRACEGRGMWTAVRIPLQRDFSFV